MSGQPHESSGLAFRLLGPLEADCDGHAVELGAPKQRLLLALLILNANNVVSREAAVDCLWVDDPPRRAEAALQVYIHNLRRLLGREHIATRGTGYLLRAETGETDAILFEQRFGEGRAALAAGDNQRAKTLLDEALGLWRGEALAGLPFVPFVAVERERARRGFRLVAEELRNEARLGLGEHPGARRAELSAFVALHPYRERIWGQLMLSRSIARRTSGRGARGVPSGPRDARRRPRDRARPGGCASSSARSCATTSPSASNGRQRRCRSCFPRPATPLIGRQPRDWLRSPQCSKRQARAS